LIRIEPDARFRAWYRALEERHMAELTFTEIRRGVQALSASWVESRHRGFAKILQGTGKRAGFALFYAPLHYLLIRGIVDASDATARPLDGILDLGCGTGAAGAAWASAFSRPPRIRGLDRNPWAVREARWSWAALGMRGHASRGEVDPEGLPHGPVGIVAAFTVNELSDEVRLRLKDRLLSAAGRGASVLITEPVARRLVPWWDEWEHAFVSAGGTGREWRFEPALPEGLRLMDRAAGLDHQILTARSLWLPGAPVVRRDGEPKA
jgi:hypothetical protein